MRASSQAGRWMIAVAISVVLLAGCSDDDDMAPVPMRQETVSAEERKGWGGAEIYDEVCDRCHKMGVDGAPELGDNAAWRPRIAKGRETLLSHVHKGFRKMPARGDCEFCSDAQLTEALDYMIEHSR